MKKVIIWTLIVVSGCVAGWFFWPRDGGTDGIENLPPEEVFIPPPPGEEPEEEPYLIDATKHLDPSNLPQSEVIREWGINLWAVVLAVSENHLTLAPISRKIEEGSIEIKVGNKKVELIVPEEIKISKQAGEAKEIGLELELKDLKLGDTLRVSIWWQKYFGLAPGMGIHVYWNVDITELERTTLPILWRGVATGRVQDISGRTITLIREKETLDILIREDAQVTMTYAGSDIPWRLDYFKKGDSASIIFVLTEEKEFEGIDVGFRRHAR